MKFSRGISVSLFLPATLLTLVACGGPPSSVSPAPTTPEAQADEPPTTTGAPQGRPEDLELPRTDPGPGQMVEPVVFGVDLDTVEAGRFDQGKMWTFEFPPAAYFAEEYGLGADSAWFARARLGALRIPNCSASLVSADGLVLTNHHCAREFVTQVSGEGEGLLDEGFYATDLADERPVEDFQADQLVDLVDVTDEVNARLDEVAESERPAAREELLEEIRTRLLEDLGGDEAGVVVEMVSLYDGGRTSAYVFRRYTAARLVMAPELRMGFFGGEPDNFTYPRYNLDFALFRLVSPAGDPLETEDHFQVDDDGLAEGDAVFIVGNPGTTNRLQTVAQLEFRRDVSDRALLELLRARIELLADFVAGHAEAAEAHDLRNRVFSLENSEKSYQGQLEGLEDPVLLARRAAAQADFQTALDADPGLLGRYGDLISRMAAVQEEKRGAADAIRAFIAFGSPVVESATLQRAFWGFQLLSAEQGGAAEDQLASLRESLEGVEQQHPQLDAALLAARFRELRRYLGPDHESVQAVLRGRSPAEAAQAVVGGSQLSDSAATGEAARSGSLIPQDPAMQVFQGLIPGFLEYNRAMSSAQQQEEILAAELGRARFEVYGTDVPPDATFSLRIADGRVASYPYNGTRAPAFTTFFGLYDRHFSFEGDPAWSLPERWLGDTPERLRLSLPMNFVSSVDITGGNSGSPVLSRELELVGVVFDGNIESLPGDYIYLPERNRSVTVDIRAILEALDEVYDMDRLVLELTRGVVVSTEAEADAAR